MNIINLLKQDHDEVADLFKKIEDTNSTAIKTREKLFTQISNALAIHMEFEETVFYPPLTEDKKTKDITYEGYQEHHVAKILIEEIPSLEASSNEWQAKVKVLQENIEHHVKEEETNMFIKAKKVFSPEELEEMGEQYALFKAEQEVAEAV